MVATTRVPHLISISQSTRKDVLKFAHHDSDVVYNCIPFDFQVEEISVPEINGKPFILDVNRFQEYKNAQLLIRALSLLKDQIPHLLYFKGIKTENYTYLEKLSKELGIENRVIFDVSYRSEGEMRYLYTHANLFVTPSLAEGFGYTPIEAAVLKTPVLVSDIPTLREVTQDRLETFDPHSPEELAGKMLNIISAPPSNETLESIADFYLKEYSQERQIERLTEVIMHNLGY